jgi:hypothetical protein
LRTWSWAGTQTGRPTAIDGALLPREERGGGALQYHHCWSSEKHAKSEGFAKPILGGGSVHCGVHSEQDTYQECGGSNPLRCGMGEALSASLSYFWVYCLCEEHQAFSSKLEDQGWRMIFISYEQGTKAYRVYDLVTDSVHIMYDVVFDDAGQWDWDEAEVDEADSTFRVEYMVMSTGVSAEVPDAIDAPRTWWHH